MLKRPSCRANSEAMSFAVSSPAVSSRSGQETTSRAGNIVSMRSRLALHSRQVASGKSAGLK